MGSVITSSKKAAALILLRLPCIVCEIRPHQPKLHAMQQAKTRLVSVIPEDCPLSVAVLTHMLVFHPHH